MPRNLETSRKMRDESREKILGTALKLFAVRGVAAAKIGDIAKEAEISQGLLYHYFGSKNDIYVELVRTAYANMNEAARWLSKQDLSPREKIELAIDRLMQGIVENEAAGYYYLLMANAAISDATPEPAREIIRKQNPLRYRVMSKIFTQAMEQGDVPHSAPDRLALLFWSTFTGLAITRATQGKRFPAPDSETVKAMFLANRPEHK